MKALRGFADDSGRLVLDRDSPPKICKPLLVGLLVAIGTLAACLPATPTPTPVLCEFEGHVVAEDGKSCAEPTPTPTLTPLATPTPTPAPTATPAPTPTPAPTSTPTPAPQRVSVDFLMEFMKTNPEQLMASYRGEKIELFTNDVVGIQAYQNLTWSILMASDSEPDETDEYITDIWQIRAEVSSDRAAAAAEGEPYALECVVEAIDVMQEEAEEPSASDSVSAYSRFHRLYCLGQD